MKRDLYRKGLWTVEEDQILAEYVEVHGKGWSRVPLATGLRRCGKSCRLRWVNYLSPDVKRGNFSREEEDLIIRLHNLLGNRFFLRASKPFVTVVVRSALDGLGCSFRWSLIAGRVPGRTDNQVKNHWNSHLRKKLCSFYRPGCRNHNALGSSSSNCMTSGHRPNAKRSKAGLMSGSDPIPSSDKREEDMENNASSSRISTGPASQRGEVEANNVCPSALVWLYDDQLGLASAPNSTGCLGDFALDFILYGR